MTGPNLHLGPTLGCEFVGALFAIALYGLGTAQFTYYVRKYTRDPLWLRAVVLFLWLVDTARTMLDGAVIWQSLVQAHATPADLTVMLKTFIAEYFLNTLSVFIVQCYLIYTIRSLVLPTQTWVRVLLPAAALILAALSFAGNCGAVYKVTLNRTLTVALHNVEVPASIATCSAVICDIYITVSLCLILQFKRTGFSRTEYFISALTGFAIRRGIFTVLVQGLHFLTYIATLHQLDLYWMLFHFPASKIYVISMLSMLNVRDEVRARGQAKLYGGNNTTISMSDMAYASRKDSSQGTHSSGKSTTLAAAGHSHRDVGIKYTVEVLSDGSRV